MDEDELKVMREQNAILKRALDNAERLSGLRERVPIHYATQIEAGIGVTEFCLTFSVNGQVFSSVLIPYPTWKDFLAKAVAHLAWYETAVRVIPSVQMLQQEFDQANTNASLMQMMTPQETGE